jgi:hypothetical protein
LPKVGDGITKVTKKKLKKGELSSFSIETWWWNLRTSKKNRKKGEQAPFLLELSNGTHLHQ